MLVAVGVMGLLIGALVGTFVGRSTAGADSRELRAAIEDAQQLRDALQAAEDRATDAYLEAQRLRAQIEDGAPTAGAEVPAGYLADGVYRVGEDIEPGVYTGEPTTGIGYWARLKSVDGTVHSIVANQLVRGPFSLEVVASDYALELRGVRITRE